MGKTVYILHEKDSTDVIDKGYELEGLTELKQTKYCPIGEYQSSSEFSTGFCYYPKTSIDNDVHEEIGFILCFKFFDKNRIFSISLL